MKQILRIYFLMGLVLVGVQVEGLGREIEFPDIEDTIPPEKIEEEIKKDALGEKALKGVDSMLQIIQPLLDSLKKDENRKITISFRADTAIVNQSTNFSTENSNLVLKNINNNPERKVPVLIIECEDSTIVTQIHGVLDKVNDLEKNPTWNPSEILNPFIDLFPNGVFLYHPQKQGQFPIEDGAYIKEFQRIVSEVKKNSKNNEPYFIPYTFFDPQKDNVEISKSYAYVVYIEELNWLVGVAIPDAAIHNILLKIMQEKLKAEEEKLAAEEEKSFLFIVFSIISFLLLMLAFHYFLQIRKEKVKIAKKNQELMFERDKTEAAVKARDMVIAEKEKIIVQKNMYLTAADLASSYIAMFDENYRLVWCNKTFASAYGEYAIDKHFKDFTSHTNPPALMQDIGAMKRRNIKEPLPPYQSTLNGKQVQSVITLFPKNEESSEQKNWFVLVDTDVDDLVKKEDSLKKTEEALKSISELILHNYGSQFTLLAEQIDNLEFLLENKNTESEIEANIKNIETTKTKLQFAINILGEYAKVHINSLDSISEREYDLKEFVENLLLKFHDLAIENNRNLINKIPSNVKIRFRRPILISILDHLIFNAIIYSGKMNSRISLCYESKNGTHKISVQDNGVGIPETEKGRLFLTKKSSKSKGLGRGLFLSKQILNMLKGDIYLDNEYSSGAKFDVTFSKI